MNHFQEVINFIPTGITIFIFFMFLKTNKNTKKFEAGPIKYEAKDEAIRIDASIQNHNKDAEQDKTIHVLFEKIKSIEDVLEKNLIENGKHFGEINIRLDKNYEYIKEAAIKSCIAIIVAPNSPLIEFFDAVFLCLYLGGNGNTINFAVKRLLEDKQNLEIYKSCLVKFRKEHKRINSYFEEAIKQIHNEWH